MSSFTLKMIAIISMLIDHIGVIFIPNDDPKYQMLYLIFRCIGRLAFPIFCFLIVEGFYHTRDVKRYLTRLGIFALISEIPFDLAFYHYNFHTDVITDLSHYINGDNLRLVIRLFNNQNVFITLFLGLLTIYIMDTVDKKLERKIFELNFYNALITLVSCAVAVLVRSDYSCLGVLLITAFYLFRGSKSLCGISIFLILGFLTGDFLYGVCATLTIIFIMNYNGTKGKDVKYLFYIFYPAHLFLLYLIKLFL